MGPHFAGCGYGSPALWRPWHRRTLPSQRQGSHEAKGNLHLGQCGGWGRAEISRWSLTTHLTVMRSQYQTANSFRDQTRLVEPKKPAGLSRRAPYAVTLLPRGLGGFRDWCDPSGRKLRIGRRAASATSDDHKLDQARDCASDAEPQSRG